MGKKKRISSDKIRKSKNKVKAANPFEYKVVKNKFDTLNTKARSYQKSNPGQSRVKAHKKREDTLLKEWKKRDKKSKFVDGRIGKGKQFDLNDEDAAMEMFAIEARKKSKSWYYKLCTII